MKQYTLTCLGSGWIVETGAAPNLYVSDGEGARAFTGAADLLSWLREQIDVAPHVIPESPPAAVAPSEEVRTPTPPRAPAHPAEGASPDDEQAPEPETGPEPEPDVDWTALVARVAAGESAKDVAEEAGVPVARLSGRFGAAVRRGKVPPTSRPAVVEAIKPALAPAPSNPADVPDAYFWTPRQDLLVLERFTAGETSYGIAQRLGGTIKPADVISRFKMLVPKPGIVEQREALARLKKLVTEADARFAPLAAE